MAFMFFQVTTACQGYYTTKFESFVNEVAVYIMAHSSLPCQQPKSELCLVKSRCCKKKCRERLSTLFIINCEQLQREAESHGPAEHLSETKAI